MFDHTNDTRLNITIIVCQQCQLPKQTLELRFIKF